MTQPTPVAPESALRRGLRCRCPRCGEGPLLRGFLKIRDSCPACGLDYGFADPADGPAFFGMSLVGTLGMAAFMAFDFTVRPPIWVHLVVTFPLLAIACLAVLIPPISIIAIGALLVLLLRGRRREGEKFAGLRILR